MHIIMGFKLIKAMNHGDIMKIKKELNNQGCVMILRSPIIVDLKLKKNVSFNFFFFNVFSAPLMPSPQISL